VAEAVADFAAQPVALRQGHVQSRYSYPCGPDRYWQFSYELNRQFP
jgi:hypothetical protein